MKIYFEDKGQDFLEWTINKKGFVTKSEPFQTWVWEGTKIILASIKIGMRPIVVLRQELENIPIDSPEKKFLERATELNYKVIKIRR